MVKKHAAEFTQDTMSTQTPQKQFRTTLCTPHHPLYFKLCPQHTQSAFITTYEVNFVEYIPPIHVEKRPSAVSAQRACVAVKTLETVCGSSLLTVSGRQRRYHYC